MSVTSSDQPPAASPAPNEAPVAEPGSDLHGVRVLVVEDERDARALIRRILEKRGAVVRTAASASEAIALLSVEPFHVLVSDIGLPGEDGYVLIKRVRELPVIHGGTVAAVALTAYTRAEDRTRAIRAGFHMHLPKPVEAKALAVVVDRMARIPQVKAS